MLIVACIKQVPDTCGIPQCTAYFVSKARHTFRLS